MLEEPLVILLPGPGGREHALAWAFAKSPLVSKVLCVPGNAGTSAMGEKVENLSASSQPYNWHELVILSRERGVNLVVPCTDQLLVDGIVPYFEKAGFKTFGPSKEAAELEGSKSFAKRFMLRHGISTASYRTFSDAAQAMAYINSSQDPLVIKVSGLAAGTGVVLPATKDEARVAVHSMMVEKVFGDAADEILIEERLFGHEVSITLVTDGHTFETFPAGQDAQRILDGNIGANTGGMGVYAPTPLVDDAMFQQIKNDLLQPTIKGMREEGRMFIGFICVGLMITSEGPKMIEYNARFGDPEAQALLPLLDENTDLAEIAVACTESRLGGVHFGFLPLTTVAVVIAMEGYPGVYPVGERLSIRVSDIPKELSHSQPARRCIKHRIHTNFESLAMPDSPVPNDAGDHGSRLPEFSIEEPSRSGFQTSDEPHPTDIVASGPATTKVGIQELRDAIPPHCFKPNYLWSLLYLFRDLAYAVLLLYLYSKIPVLVSQSPFRLLQYPLLIAYSFAQGLVWTGLWIIAHECGHSAFSTSSFVNDAIGFVLHSFLLAPYFSWKSTHRRHHLYAGHMDKDINYVPPLRDVYAAKLGLNPGQLDELGEDAPIVLFLRIILQQTIGWNWYILSNITCPPSALVKKGMPTWRHSHFDPWGAMFRTSEVMAIILSDVGCLVTLASLWALYKSTASIEQVFWIYIAPWTWVNHWIVMITYLHHTHPSIPKYASEEWTFILGATATMDRYFSWPFGIIGTHFFHNISTDHVIHHLFSRIPHYYAREATNAIVPLLGQQYKRGAFGWDQLKLSFAKCQWVEADETKDDATLSTGGASEKATEKATDKNSSHGLWYRSGPSPSPEYRMRQSAQDE